MNKLISIFWNNQLIELEKNIVSYGWENLLRWPVINKMMFMKNPVWSGIELKYLQSLDTWESRWSKAIEESIIGNPINNSNLIHMAYHIAKFETITKQRIEEMNNIFEFGGGYGCMCRLIHSLGFTGIYTIYDLPKFLEIQKYYLDNFKIYPNLLSGHMADLDTQAYLNDNNLFISTWALSEAPNSMRNLILRQLDVFTHYLVAYQLKFEGIDNKTYFKEWRDLQSKIDWHDWEIEHIPKNYYTIGGKK